MALTHKLYSNARPLYHKVAMLGQPFVLNSHARRLNSTIAEELDAVRKWRGDAVGASTVLWDRMDPRQITLLDQTIRPYLPASYPRLPRDSQVSDIAEGSAMPPGAHLVYFPSPSNEFELSPDGYLADEAPPKPFEQRVWAGGLMEFNPANPLRVGDLTSQTKRVENVTIKERAGADPLVLVKLALQMNNSRGACATEYRNLAYMKPIDLGRRIVKHNRQPDFIHRMTPSEILLFRYSALSWNSHRIHYDSVYACQIEHHPGLLVHGPLTCTLLLQFLHGNMPEKMALRSFDYRAISPMYCQQELHLNGRWLQATQPEQDQPAADGTRRCELWATNNEGGIAMKGVATLVPLF